jgi:hypothetical protein
MKNRIPCLNVSYSKFSTTYKGPQRGAKEVVKDIERRLQQVTFKDLAIGTLPISLVESICIIKNPHSYPDNWASHRV